MVRSTHYLRIIEEEHLVENAAKVGAYFLDQLRDLQNEFDFIRAVRGRGLFLAFDLPDAKTRDRPLAGSISRIRARPTSSFSPFSATLLFEPTVA